MSDLFVINSGVLPPGTRVMAFRGVETISAPYRFEIYVVVDQDRAATVELDEVVGRRMSLTMHAGSTAAAELGLDARPPFHFHGMVSSIQLVNDADGRTVYAVTLVPHLHQLSLSVHSRVFTKKSIVEIIEDVLIENGFSSSEYELRLSGQYPKEEHVTQYKESDLAFVSRWMEREGLYYFFEHGERREKVIVTDDRALHPRAEAGTVRYYTGSIDHVPGERFSAISLRRKALPARVQVADYDYARPAAEVSGSEPVTENGLGDVSIYGDRAFTAEQTRRLAKLRAQAFRAEETTLTASGTARYLRAGYMVEIDGHPRASGEYLLTRVEHVGRNTIGSNEADALLEGTGPEVYRSSVTAIPREIQFRSQRTTPWPRIHCFENAIVDGAAQSQYAQVDELGRYAIKLKFDESTLRHGKASTWVRMAQPHGGSVEGFHFPLRKGTEVLVTFLGGDPDRPVIAAVLPNAATPSPVVAGNNTKNVIQTGGASRIEIEDIAGGQYVKHSTPVANTMMWMGATSSPGGHNVELSTDGTGLASYGSNFDAFVGGAKTERVVGPVSHTYDATYATTVTGDVTQTYLANQTTSVLANVARTVTGAQTETVVGPVTQTFTATYGLSVTGPVTEVYAAQHSLAVTGAQNVSVTGADTQTYQSGLSVTVNGGKSTHTANADYALDVKANATIKASSALDLRGDATAELSAPTTTIHGDSSVDVSGTTIVRIGPTEITVNGSTLVKLSSPAVIEIAGGTITVTGGNVTVDATASITQVAGGSFTASGASTLIKGSVIDLSGPIKMNC